MTFEAIIANVAKWVPDLLAMPTRIREISAAAKADRDPRAICQSCGQGRVGVDAVSFRPDTQITAPYGRCTACGATWTVDPTSVPTKLVSLEESGRHLPTRKG